MTVCLLTGTRRNRPYRSGSTACSGHGRQRVELRALCAAENAAAARRRSGAALLASRYPARERRKQARSWRRGVNRRLHLVQRAAPQGFGVQDKESSGSSGARSEGRLHSSVRGIFPSRRFRLQGRRWPRRIARIGCSTRHGASPFRAKRVLCGRAEAEQRPRESPVRQRCRTSNRRKALWVARASLS